MTQWSEGAMVTPKKQRSQPRGAQCGDLQLQVAETLELPRYVPLSRVGRHTTCSQWMRGARQLV